MEVAGEDGFVLLTGCKSVTAATTSTTLVSNSFTSTSVPTSSRIVVFEERISRLSTFAWPLPSAWTKPKFP